MKARISNRQIAYLTYQKIFNWNLKSGDKQCYATGGKLLVPLKYSVQ